MSKVSIKWARVHEGGYEITTRGDVRFSAMVAVMPDGRTIEMWYQCDLKGYQPGGKNISLGKGKKPLIPYSDEDLYQAYKTLWRVWAVNNISLMNELLMCARNHKNTLTDMFAHTPINQARALSEILNEWVVK